MKIKDALRCSFRILASGVLLSGFMVQALWLHLRYGRQNKQVKVRMVSGFCTRVLAVLNVRISIDYPYGQSFMPSPVIMISNHLSFLDVFILAARFPAVFITSTELRDSFLVGWVSRLSGCLFVDRRNPRKLHREMAEIRRVLGQRHSVTFFPESTSSNGEQVLPFRSALFSIPLATGTPVLPVVLNYKAVNGVYDPASFKENVFYYGDHKFFVQLWRVLKTKSIDIVLSFLPLEHFPSQIAERGDRQESARQLHHRISSAYKPLTPEKA